MEDAQTAGTGYAVTAGTQYTTTRVQTGWRRFIHLEWVRMPMGLLKIVEGVIILLALAIMGSLRNITGTGYSSIEFFYFVHSTSFIMVLLTILLYVANIFHRLPAIMICNMVWTVMCGVGAFMHLISSAVVMDKYHGHDTILAGGSFGIIASFLFVFETVFYFLKWRNNGPYQTSGVEAITDFSADRVATSEEGGAY